MAENMNGDHKGSSTDPMSAKLNADWVKQQMEKQQQGNFHSSSLKKLGPSMASASSVNRTALHPGGVQ